MKRFLLLLPLFSVLALQGCYHYEIRMKASACPKDGTVAQAPDNAASEVLAKYSPVDIIGAVTGIIRPTVEQRFTEVAPEIVKEGGMIEICKVRKWNPLDPIISIFKRSPKAEAEK